MDYGYHSPLHGGVQFRAELRNKPALLTRALAALKESRGFGAPSIEPDAAAHACGLRDVRAGASRGRSAASQTQGGREA